MVVVLEIPQIGRACFSFEFSSFPVSTFHPQAHYNTYDICNGAVPSAFFVHLKWETFFKFLRFGNVGGISSIILQLELCQNLKYHKTFM